MSFRRLLIASCLCVAVPVAPRAFAQVPSSDRPAARRTSLSDRAVTATSVEDQVRFAALGSVVRMRLEVFDQTGDRVYDSGAREGSLLDWRVEAQNGRRLPDGLYGCIVTLGELAGLESHREAFFRVQRGEVVFAQPSAVESPDPVTVLVESGDRPITRVAHDGEKGLVVSGRGGLSFGSGDLFAGRSVDQMRLTREGKVGIGVEEPAAKLDVAGLIRTSEGIQFPDGTIQKTAAAPGALAFVAAAAAAGAGGIAAPIGVPSARVQKQAGGADAGFSRVYSLEGANNTFFGGGAGTNITTGLFDAFFGTNAGNRTTAGADDAFFGWSAGEFNTTGLQNSFFGCEAGRFNTTGQNNTFVGYDSGAFSTSESNNTFVGAFTNGVTGITGAGAVGALAQVTRSNALVLGGINGVNGATSDTNVGIGTTNPDRLLVLEGAQALARFTRFNDTGASFGPAYLCERGRGTRAAPADIVAGDHLGKVQFRGRVGGNMLEYGAFSFVAADTAQNGRFGFFDRDIATERVSILNTGNVGIGTTAPTERLHVVGNIRVTGSIITGAPAEPAPDYVFEPDYQLLPLDEVARYVAREKHLPRVPKASEIREKGIDVGDLQMKLLEKIEELTVYAIQAAKTNAELRARLAAVEKLLGAGTAR